MDEARIRILRALAIAGAGVAGVIFVAFVLLVTLNLSLFAPGLEKVFGRAINRQVVIGGELRVIAFPEPALRLGDVYIGNAPGGKQPALLVARTVEARFSLAGGWTPRLRVADLVVEGATLSVEPTPGGASWLMAKDAPARAGLLRLPGVPWPIEFRPASITATDLTIIWRAPGQLLLGTLYAERAIAERSGRLGEHVTIFGKRGVEPWRLDADLSSVAALATGESFRIKGEFDGLGGTASFAGAVAFDGRHKTQFSGAGKIEDTGHFFGGPQSLKSVTTPAEFTFSVSNSGQAKVITAKFAKLGSGDLDVALEFRPAPHSVVTGKIEADRLDLQALPQVPIGATFDRLLLTTPFPVESLQRAQVEVRVDASAVTWGEKPLGRLELGLWANNGILAAGPVRFRGPAADISGDATLDVRDEPKLSMTLRAKLFEIGMLLQPIREGTVSDGRIDAGIEIMGAGRSLADMLATAYGQTDLLIGPGVTDASVATVIPAELAHGLPPDRVEASDAALEVSCVISRFDISEGRAVSRALMVDTANAVTTGQGTIDLGKETLDFQLTPRPKDPALIGQARDFVVSGTLRAPVFTPVDGEASRGLSRLAGQAALTQGFDALMPLLDAEAALANPCVRSLLAESALANLEAQIRKAERSELGGRSVAQVP